MNCVEIYGPVIVTPVLQDEQLGITMNCVEIYGPVIVTLVLQDEQLGITMSCVKTKTSNLTSALQDVIR